MILDMQGGFRTEERGGVEMKVGTNNKLPLDKQIVLILIIFI